MKVDVEDAGRKPRRGGVMRLARRWLAVDEADSLEAISDEGLRNHRFLQLWTLKEACVKAAGTGAAHDQL